MSQSRAIPKKWVEHNPASMHVQLFSTSLTTSVQYPFRLSGAHMTTRGPSYQDPSDYYQRPFWQWSNPLTAKHSSITTSLSARGHSDNVGSTRLSGFRAPRANQVPGSRSARIPAKLLVLHLWLKIVMSIGIWYFYPKFLSELGQKTSNSTQHLVKYWYFLA